MRKRVFTLHEKKHYSEEEYIKARNEFLNYQNEQKQSVAHSGFASEFVILAGSQSEIIAFSSISKSINR